MKNKVLILLVATMLLAAGCGQSGVGEGEDIGQWSITIDMIGEKEVEFTNEDASSIGPSQIKAAEKDKDVFGDEQIWQGILLEDLLEFVGVEDFSVISIISADGSMRELDPERISEGATGIGWMVDGEMLDEERGPIQFIADQRGPNWWVKKVEKIEIIR